MELRTNWMKALPAVLMLSACGAKSGSEELLGTWSSGCVNRSIEKLTFSWDDSRKADLVTVQVESYSDAECTKPVALAEGRLAADFSASKSNESGMRSFDFKVNSSWLTLLSPRVVEIWNRDGVCGVTNWRVGVPVDTSSGSFVRTACSIGKLGEVVHAFYKIEGEFLSLATSDADSSTYRREL